MSVIQEISADVMYAFRLFARAPAWTAVAVLSLTLGIGVNLLIFSIVDAVLLRPFPYASPSQLMFIWGAKDDAVRRGISGQDLADWQARNHSFQSIDAFLGQMTLSLGEGGDAVAGACVGPQVLSMLGVQPALGRGFLPADARPGADTVVVVSDGFWRTHLAASPAAVGSTLRLSGRTYEVIGVMPVGFFFPDTNTQLLVSTPCGAPNFWERGGSFAHAVGRLRPGISVAAAEADLDAINRDLARTYPETNGNVTTGVQPFRNIVVGKYERSLWLLMAAVFLVLLIACANVAHLQLARGLDRRREFAIRTANGAGRARLFRQMLTESLLLALISGGCAMAVSWWGVRAIRSLSLTDIARLDTARLDWRVAAAAAGLAVVSALVTGVWPARQAAGVQINDVLTVGGSATVAATRRSLRELLAISEVALATVLLIVAGLLIGSFVRLSRAQWGFDPDHLFAMSVLLPATASSSSQGGELWKEALRRRVQKIGDVRAVATTKGVPMRYTWRPTKLVLQGRMLDWGAAEWTVSEGYFRTMGTHVLYGREFGVGDTATAPPVVVVSRSLARRLWPGASAIGRELQVPRFRTVNGVLAPDIAARMHRRDKTLMTDMSAFEVEIRTVVGEVDDIRAFGLDLVPDPAFYVDARQVGSVQGYEKQTYLVVRTTGDARNIGAKVRAILSSDELHGELRSIDSMSELVAHSIGGRGSTRLMMLVATVFGGLALALTTTGIFGIMLHTVNQRLPEMGVRIALGARRSDIARIVFGYGFRVMGMGLALGLALAWATSRTLRSLLFELEPTDAYTYVTAALILVVAVFAACVVPVRRAVRCDAAGLFRS